MRSCFKLMSFASPEGKLELLAVAASAKRSTTNGPKLCVFKITFAKSKWFQTNIFLCNQPGSLRDCKDRRTLIDSGQLHMDSARFLQGTSF